MLIRLGVRPLDELQLGDFECTLLLSSGFSSTLYYNLRRNGVVQICQQIPRVIFRLLCVGPR